MAMMQAGSLCAMGFREEMMELSKKRKDPTLMMEEGYPISYPTKFMEFDHRNGLKVSVTNMQETECYHYKSIGLQEGNVVMFIAKTGAGKTTAAIQMAAGIVEQYPNSMILHECPEPGGINKPRVQAITGWNTAFLENHYILRTKGITTESFYERVVAHCKMKHKLAEKYPDAMMHYTGALDVNGKPVRQLIPTVVILDSVPCLYPKDIMEKAEDGDQSNNMTAARIAKANTYMIKTLSQILAASNTILIMINHINPKINTGMMPTAAQINYLKQDESLPGGNALLYLCNNIVKVVASTKLTDDKEFGINGWYAKVGLVKSRTNRAGQESIMVYEQEHGYSRMLSNFKMLKDNGRIAGSGWYHIDGFAKKFQQKSFLQTFHDEPLLRRAMMESTMDVCNEFLTHKDDVEKKTEAEQHAELDAWLDNLDNEIAEDEYQLKYMV